MNAPAPFHAYGTEHLIAIFLTVTLPFALAALVRRTGSRSLERGIVIAVGLVLLANYVAYLVFVGGVSAMAWTQMLPMQMCDWAIVVIIVAMWTANARWVEVAYFWGIGGTLQAVLTPNLHYGFPDIRFICFFVSHCGVIIGIAFLMLARRLRPSPISIVRVFGWSELYFVVALCVDAVTGVNYGFLLHKPEAFSLLSYLSDWRPLYLLQMQGLALVFFLLLYAPFALADLFRAPRAVSI